MARASKQRFVGGAAVATAALAGAAISVTGSAPAAAGSGTPSDPWYDFHVYWDAPEAEYASGTRGDIRPTGQGVGGNFWAHYQQQQQGQNRGYYSGIQINGRTWGSNGSSVPQRVASFSVFNGTQNRVRNLAGDRCSITADGGVGVSCAVPYNWSVGNVYRFESQALLSNNPAECPTASPNACLVYSAKAFNVGTGIEYHIGRWSLGMNPVENGRITSTVHFLEHFTPWDHDCGNAGGRFSRPQYRYDDWKSGNISSFNDDRSACGRAHLSNSETSAISLI